MAQLQAELADARAELARLREEQEQRAEKEARLRKARDRAVKSAEFLSEALVEHLRRETAAVRRSWVPWQRSQPVTPQESVQLEVIRSSALFDAAWYLRTYSDVVRLGEEPALHFLRHPFHPFRRPSEHFDTGQYVLDHPQVLAERINPLVHFLSSPESDGATSYPPRPR